MIVQINGRLYTDCNYLIKKYPSTYGRIYTRKGKPLYIKGGTKTHRKQAKDAIFLARSYQLRKAYSTFGGWY